ncbi:hypothetical protein FA95DRAFT_1602357 [Auriscalpium vulgare]|uniref:Uncharacterized protein n=1 Tax=Auriscalpium vulgare TaxID=40419 RepID=A0ACB8S6I8_9AGAM|nr:hypothetical protein FA95DRAFT_1602357 [Auriscalpium vulgare]
MPPKKSTKQTESSSRDLVTVGPRDVSAKHHGARLNDQGLLPTTARALVLRNGKHGAMGTGEIMSTRKPSGREKLDLLGDPFIFQTQEDLIAKAQTALADPFKLGQCLKIADSQFNLYLDGVVELQDHETFYTAFKTEIHSRFPPAPTKDQLDPLRKRDVVFAALGTRIHNLHMLASAWRIIRDHLDYLDQLGIVDARVQSQLREDSALRTDYLVLYDMVNVLTDALQANFSLLATKSDYHSQYFRKDEEDNVVTFDWNSLRASYKSFVDSIVIELCLPHSQFPKYVLTSMLQEAIEEVPSEAKRFPQALWDALGDLSMAVRLQEILERPLLVPEGKAWKAEKREMPDTFNEWVNAQGPSDEASKALGPTLDIIVPLENAKKKNVVDMMWKRINKAYEASTGMDIETLWQLKGETHRIPKWGTQPPPSEKGAKGAAPYKPGKGKRRLAITDSADDGDSDGSMPSLETVSDSTQEENEDGWSTSDEDDESDEGSEDEEAGYDTDEEEEFRDLLREAMEAIHANPEFMDPTKKTPEEILADDRKGNPFLKLLGSLRGRMFSANPTLRTTDRGESRSGAGTRLPPRAAGQGSQGRNVTVEEVEDEDAETGAAKKKKKKPKKKKKKTSASSAASEQGTEAEPTSPVPPPIVPKTPPPTSTQTLPVTPTSAKKKTPATPKSPPPAARLSSPGGASTATLANMSTTSLELGRQQSAQSARSYLQSEHKDQKVKTKSRPDYGNLAAIPEKKGFFSRFSRKEPKPAEEKEKEKQSMTKWFGQLTKKASLGMHQILGTKQGTKQAVAPMKWDTFVKIMKDMGFTYDPSTAGSSVRFDPPAGIEVRSISFHKPHPENTIDPVTLREWGKKLKDYYGWSEEIFSQSADAN